MAKNRELTVPSKPKAESGFEAWWPFVNLFMRLAIVACPAACRDPRAFHSRLTHTLSLLYGCNLRNSRVKWLKLSTSIFSSFRVSQQLKPRC